MESDEVKDTQDGSRSSDFFSIQFREYLPKEKCTPTTWNDVIRVRLQYEFTNLVSVFVLSKDEKMVLESQNKLQRIVFEILSAVLHHEDINSTLAIEFLENSSIVSYLKICKLLGYDFLGKNDLDIDEISSIEIKNEFKAFLFNSKDNTNEKLPPFTNYIEKFITPFIMDAAWLIQMSYNETQSYFNQKWVEFMARLCRGNITSKERPLPSIPKSVKLINIKDIVFYLDLGKTDNMGITDSLISRNFRLQQKYVRERTRVCFTVDSFATQRECLKGFSILAILIKIYFDQSFYLSDFDNLSNINGLLDTKSEVNLDTDSLSKCGSEDNIELNFHNNEFKTVSIWNVILRYDLSIQRSIGIIFEVFISFCSNLSDSSKNSFELFNNKLFTSLKCILEIFPRKIVSKSYLIFIEYFSDVYNLLKQNSMKNDNNAEINFGNEKYYHAPWLVNNQSEIGDVLNLSFFILSSVLIKMDYINFNGHFKQKLIEWDELFWSSNDYKNKDEEIYKEKKQNREITSEFIPLTTLINIKEAYQYYHLVFNTQLNNEKPVSTGSPIELVLKEILKFEGNQIYEINFNDILFILSDFMNLPSILFANAYFICNLRKDEEIESCVFNYYKRISNDFEFLREITDKTFLPICVFKTSSLIVKEKLIKILSELKIHLNDYEHCFEKYSAIYHEFCLLMDWVEKYCSYYLFKNYPEIIPLVFDIIIKFMDIHKKKSNGLNDDPKHITNFQRTPTDILFDISTNVLFPAISFLPRTPLVPEMLENSLFNRLGLNYRYKIYRKLITNSYNKYPMNYQWIYIRKLLSKHLKGVTRDILTYKSETKNSNDTFKIPPIPIRLLVSNIISLSYTNPLVVCDIVINQCNIYDNMIPLLIEIVGENINEITLDIMVFTIINFILSRESSDISSYLRSRDINNSKLGPGGIARFVALLFSKRRVPKDVAYNFIHTIMYRIDETLEGIEQKCSIPTSISDIVFWKQFVEIVLSTPIVDISVLTKRQLKSLGGGPILFQSSFSQCEGNSLENNTEYRSNVPIQNTNPSSKQTHDLVISMLKGEIRTKEILFRLAKLKSEILWNTSEDSIAYLKFLVNLLDEIHWCCIQTIEFLRRSFNSETYRYHILEIESGECFSNAIYQTFIYLDIPTGWSFIRPGIRSQSTQIEDKTSELQNNNIIDIHPEASKYIRSYILNENSDDIFLKDEAWTCFYILFWYLDISDISVPKEEYSKKLFELYNDIYNCREAIFKIVNTDPKDINNSMEKHPLSSFSDPGKMVTLPNYSRQRNLNSRQIKDNVKAHEKKLKKLYNTYFSLSREFNRILNRNKYVLRYLYSDIGITRFKDKFEANILTSNCSERNTDSFMIWICKTLITQRVTQSENDAIFTFKWMETSLFSPKIGIFSSDKGLIKSFLLILCKLVSSMIRSSTPRESQLLGLFFNYIFSFCKTLLISEFNKKNAEIFGETETMNTEGKNNNKSDELAETERNELLKKMCDKLSSYDKDQHHLDFIIECERNVLASLSLGLGLLIEKPLEISPDWIDTLNSIWMLLRCYESFPISKFSGNYLLRILPEILEYATKKQWNDLNLSINSLLLKLKQHQVNWIGNHESPQYKYQKDKTPVEEKTPGNSPEKNSSSKLKGQTKDSENKTVTANSGVNNTKRQRITSCHNYRSSFSHSKLGINRR
ncbi:giant membrane [Cryptosporidium xiaoi]|uniref:Giant membrane n=1 Tax=Cryptosporidium xiaoi TaxID=659607 RepID=A0AAV9Y3F5_9CRYT